MSRWGTILLLLLAAGAAVFLFVVDPRLRSTRDEEAMRESLLGLDPGVVRAIRIRTGAQSFEISLKDDGWWIGPQPKDRASIAGVSALLRAAADLRAIDVIRAGEMDGDLDPDDFGLSDPKSQIDFVGDGKETLYFGKEAAGTGRMYVRIGDAKDIFVVEDELQKLASRSPAEFRDRRLTALVPEQVDAFTIARDGGEIEVVRSAKGWEIVRPMQAPADGARVEQVLGAVLGARIEAFVAEGTHDLGGYGLAEPRAEIVLEIEGESRPLAVRVGADVAESEGEQVLAQFTGRDSVYHLPAIVGEALQVTPDMLRDRHFLALNPDTVDAIRFERGSETVVVERDGEEWKDATGPIPAKKVEGFVQALNHAMVEEYRSLSPSALAETGLEEPQMRISFEAWLSENTPEATAGRHPVLEVQIGKIEEGLAWARVDESPEICAIPAEALEALPGTVPPLSISAP